MKKTFDQYVNARKTTQVNWRISVFLNHSQMVKQTNIKSWEKIFFLRSKILNFGMQRVKMEIIGQVDRFFREN